MMAHVRFDYRSFIVLGAILCVSLMWMIALWLPTKIVPPQYSTTKLPDISLWETFSWIALDKDENNKFEGDIGDAVRHGIILAASGTCIVFAALGANFLWPKGKAVGSFVNIGFVVVIFLLYLMIFFFPNMRIKSDLIQSSIDWVINCRLGSIDARSQDNRANTQKPSERTVAVITPQTNTTASTNPFGLSESNADNLFIEFIKAEHTKAIEEIKQRTTIDDTWYNNKFLLVGALFAAFFTYSNLFLAKVIRRAEKPAKSAEDKDNSWSDQTADISRMFKTILPSSVLGMSCIVSLAIDLHIRSNGIITRQLGLWIQNYLECNISNTSRFIGWETFLRIDNARTGIQGLHRDYLFNIIDSAHFYFTSITLYIIYIGCLIFYFSNNRCKQSEYPVFIFIFVLVHLTMLLFSVSGNFFPSTLEVHLALWKGRWFSGEIAGITPSIICLLVTGLAFTRLCTLYKNCDSSEQSGAESHPPVPTLRD